VPSIKGVITLSFHLSRARREGVRGGEGNDESLQHLPLLAQHLSSVVLRPLITLASLQLSRLVVKRV
jgi:hypothetical protein